MGIFSGFKGQKQLYMSFKELTTNSIILFYLNSSLEKVSAVLLQSFRRTQQLQESHFGCYYFNSVATLPFYSCHSKYHNLIFSNIKSAVHRLALQLLWYRWKSQPRWRRSSKSILSEWKKAERKCVFLRPTFAFKVEQQVKRVFLHFSQSSQERFGIEF
jgi:hypothetical protein